MGSLGLLGRLKEVLVVVERVFPGVPRKTLASNTAVWAVGPCVELRSGAPSVSC